jgi:hypothetical protein
VVISRSQPHFTPGKDPVPILQETGWTPGQIWTGGKSRPHRDSIPDRPARSQSLYRQSYPAHTLFSTVCNYKVIKFVCSVQTADSDSLRMLQVMKSDLGIVSSPLCV